MLEEQGLAALALTSRLVDSAVKPFSAREFWALRRNIEPSALHGMTASEIAAEVPGQDAERIARLFDRVAGLAIALESLDHAGIWTVSGVGAGYPKRLLARLRDAAPVALHGVGDISLLDPEGVGVVGSRNVSDAGSNVARQIAHAAVKAGLPVISGAARGVDRDAMNAAFEVDGKVVGVVADALERVVSRRGTRQGIAKGRICLITPFTPSTRFSVGNAMARNKIVYGLSRCTVVVTSDRESGGTWAGATEALKNQYGRVASWTGAGSGAGNGSLVSLGAVELSEVSQLSDVLDESHAAPAVNDELQGDQLTLGF